MMQLISIYVSLFLIFSPLNGQTNDHLKEDAFSDEKKNYKLIVNSGSEIMFDSLVRLSGDSLLIASNQFEQYIAINLITEIKRIKKNKIKLGIAVGGVVGGLTSLIVTIHRDLRADGIYQLANKAILTGSGMILGAIGSAILGRDKIYNMTGWSVAQKKYEIQEIMNSE